MWIKSFKIENYKSFLETQEIELKQGFNVIVGKNNVGKTALLEALSLKHGNHPHKSLKFIDQNYQNGNSIFSIEVALDRDEIARLISLNPNRVLLINDGSVVANSLDEILKVLNSNIVLITLSNTKEGIRVTKVGKYNMELNSKEYYEFIFEEKKFRIGIKLGSYQSNLDAVIWDFIAKNIFPFKAERQNIGQGRITTEKQLETGARNLSGALNLLMTSNREKFDKLVRLINIIFPDIKDIRVPPISERDCLVYVWTHDPKTEISELAFPLNQCGTGISQILAILYVVITSDKSQVIIIDEPQSFLHPGAVRKLFEILRTEFSQHQYIITTHSPIAITSCNPQTILLVRKEGFESKIDVIDPKKNSDMKLYLEELGASLSDVFGADKVLWVEGDTEKNCFPIIIEKLVKKPLYGVTIASVRHTGDFDKKDSHLTIEIYKRLTESNSLLPPALAFIFDKEKRSEKDIEDLVRQGKLDGKETIFFIDKMMFENYLLNPKAIHHLINSIDGFNDDKIGLEKIQNWMEIYNKENSKNGVHGAKALELLFKELSGNKIEYRKVVFGQKLTEWICENSPEDFDDFKNLLGRILGN